MVSHTTLFTLFQYNIVLLMGIANMLQHRQLMAHVLRQMSRDAAWKTRSNFYKNVWNKNMFGPIRNKEDQPKIISSNDSKKYMRKDEMDECTAFWMQHTEKQRRQLVPRKPSTAVKESHSEFMQALAMASVELDDFKKDGKYIGNDNISSNNGNDKRRNENEVSQPALWPSDLGRKSGQITVNTVLQLKGHFSEFKNCGHLKQEVHSYPSVSRILDVSMPEERRQALRAWEQRMIDKLGHQGFVQYKQSMLERGRRLHKHIEEHLLLNKPLDASEDEDEVSRHHLESVKPIMSRLRNALCLESHVAHPGLQYKGIIDCVAFLRSGKLALVEWKTSEKRKMTLNQAYDTPLQVAAYIGAFNNDPRYATLGCIENSLVVHVYNDGAVADCISVEKEELEDYWQQFVKRVTLFHHTLNAT